MSDYLQNLLNAKLQTLHTAKDVKDEWRTPEHEFLGIESLFCPKDKFSIDLFTDGEINSKAKYFLTAKENALKVDWFKHCKELGVEPFGYANPPFSKAHKGKLTDGSTCTGLNKIMEKAFIQMKLGFHSVFFVPLNFEAGWFPHKRSTFPASAIYKLTDGRVTFDVPNWYKQNPAPKASKPTSSPGGMCVVIFDPEHNGTPIDDVVSRDYLRELGKSIIKQRESKDVT